MNLSEFGLDSGRVRVDFGAPAVPDVPGVPTGGGGSHKATSPPLLLCRGGNAGLCLGGFRIPDGAAVFGFLGAALAPPRGLKHKCLIRNLEFQH